MEILRHPKISSTSSGHHSLLGYGDQDSNTNLLMANDIPAIQHEIGFDLGYACKSHHDTGG